MVMIETWTSGRLRYCQVQYLRPCFEVSLVTLLDWFQSLLFVIKMKTILFCYVNAHSSCVYFGLALKSSYNWNKVYDVFFVLKGMLKDIEVEIFFVLKGMLKDIETEIFFILKGMLKDTKVEIFFVELIIDLEHLEIYPQVHLC